MANSNYAGNDALSAVFGAIKSAINDKQDLIKSATFSGTTDTNGNVQLYNGKHVVLAVVIDGDNNYCGTVYNYGSSSTGLHVTTGASTYGVVANTAITGTYYYI